MEQKTEASQAVDELLRFECVLTPDGKAEMYASDDGPYVWLDHVRAALKAHPAPTEAPQGNTSNNSSSSQPSGNTGELAQGDNQQKFDRWFADNDEPNKCCQQAFKDGLAAQGEDSARLDAQVTAAARVLANRSADACGVNRDVNWKVYSQDFIDDARAALHAARASAETGGVKP